MYHRCTQSNWNVCSAKFLDLGPERLRSALARVAKLVDRRFSDGRDYQLPDWLLLSSLFLFLSFIRTYVPLLGTG